MLRLRSPKALRNAFLQQNAAGRHAFKQAGTVNRQHENGQQLEVSETVVLTQMRVRRSRLMENHSPELGDKCCSKVNMSDCTGTGDTQWQQV